MGSMWLQSAVWLGLAASIRPIRIARSVAVTKIIVGATAGKAIGRNLSERARCLAAIGALLFPYPAGTEFDAEVVRAASSRR